jgi:hypothetical protein
MQAGTGKDEFHHHLRLLVVAQNLPTMTGLTMTLARTNLFQDSPDIWLDHMGHYCVGMKAKFA